MQVPSPALPHGPQSREQSVHTLLPGSAALSISHATSGKSHALHSGGIQGATEGQVGHPLELPGIAEKRKLF